MATLSRIVITYDIDEPDLDRLRQEFSDINFTVCPSKEQWPEVVPGTDAIIGGPPGADVLAQCSDLRWIQSHSAGVDSVLTPDLIEHGLILTNYSGVQASNMAEHILTMMYVFARGLPTLMRHQFNGEWIKQPPDELPRLPQTRFFSRYTFELKRQTLAVAGLGDVGSELAWRAKGVGMRVIGSKRRPGDPPPGVDQLYGPDDWYEMLAEADHLAICLPLTSRTRYLFGETEFKAMKPNAYIYNTSRGAIINQDALIDALQRGQIAGAGLYVTTPEPLPKESPLWYMPNVLVTAHTSGASPLCKERGIEIVVENIHRYLQDQPLMNVVDKREGY